ncbi:MAG TPA: formimidoylglutamate deiminase [Stellaceae bacterium]|nr:formimidoylglutamate deiminase [Stellaceae bacterium]
MTALFAETALLPIGWASRVRIDLDTAGNIAAVEAGVEPGGAERCAGPLLPGMPNLHSHAFQRAFAGLTERSGTGGDDFWSWRQIMYRCLAVLEPEDVRSIAAQLYVEMLKAGYTAVGEFHYIHNGRDGAPYADRLAMSTAVVDAAADAGIGLTLLPVLYRANGFGGAPPSLGQRRFIVEVDGLLEMIAALVGSRNGNPDLRIGIAPHSLRAVPPEDFSRATEGMRRLDPTAPIHLHIAEQTAEVEQCIAWSGQRPVAWLLEHAAVDAAWCLVHATHMETAEAKAAAATGAVVGICPSTEGNLGDGFFPMEPYREAGGRWGIGSDSHVSVNPVEELRWLDYGERLRRQRRALASESPEGSAGTALWRKALEGGTQALARPIGAIEAGRRADFLVLDADAPALYGRGGDLLMDSLIFASAPPVVRDVMVGGRWVVEECRHRAEGRILAAFRHTMDRLAAALTS